MTPDIKNYLPKKTKTDSLMVRLPADVVERLKKACAANGWSLTEAVEQALTMYLDELEKLGTKGRK